MIKLSNKAKSLTKFRLKNAEIPKLKIFKVSEFQKSPKKIISFIGKLNSAKGYDLFGKAMMKILSEFKNLLLRKVNNTMKCKY